MSALARSLMMLASALHSQRDSGVDRFGFPLPKAPPKSVRSAEESRRRIAAAEAKRARKNALRASLR